MVATQEQTHNYIKYYRAREGGGRPGGVGGGGGKRHCTLVHIPVYMYMNRVLPKRYKEVYSYLSLDCTFRKGLLHGMSFTQEKKSCMTEIHEVTYSTGWINTIFEA